MDNPVPTLRQGMALYFIVLGLVILPGSLVYYLVGEYWRQPLLAALLMQVLFIVAPLWIAARACGWNTARAYRLVPVAPSVALFAVLASVALVPAAELIELGVEKLLPVPSFLEEVFRDLLHAEGAPDWAMTLLTVAVVPGIGEEVLFRGAILSSVARRFTPYRAVFASALLFGIMHMNPWQFTGALVLGMIYGLMAWWTGSIVPSVLAHAVNNTCFIVLANLFGGEPQPLTPAERAIAVTVATTISVLCLLAIRARRRREELPAPPMAADLPWPR